jgi:hypothetical protein
MAKDFREHVRTIEILLAAREEARYIQRKRGIFQLISTLFCVGSEYRFCRPL